MTDQRSISAFLPDYGTEGFGAAILSPRLTGIGKSAAFIYFEDRKDPRISCLAQILQRSNQQIVRETRLGSGHAVFLPPSVLLGKRQWAALGIPDHRLQNPQYHHDILSAPALRRLQDRAFADLNVKTEQIAPRLLGSNRYMQDVYDGVMGRSLLQNGAWHAEWEPSKDGRRKGGIRPDSFLRGVTPETFIGCARAIAVMIAAYSNETGRRFRELTGRFFQRYTGRGSEAKPDGLERP